MPTHKVLVIGVLAVTVLAAIGAGVHLVPWLREHRTDISLLLLMLLLIGSGFTVALALITTFFAAPAPENTPQEWVCPGCNGTVRQQVPIDLVPAHYHEIAVPQWSHLDGTQLCPVIGPHGYHPADPISSRTTTSETA